MRSLNTYLIYLLIALVFVGSVIWVALNRAVLGLTDEDGYKAGALSLITLVLVVEVGIRCRAERRRRVWVHGAILLLAHLIICLLAWRYLPNLPALAWGAIAGAELAFAGWLSE
jgi:hypothetical protein